ncbi:response regulator [Ectothiorhodospiraceae bacterium WFHF3C12]|nr:response regulator [Ectothiorhodospiraceae bacterium WFHF3C12]
MVQHIGLEDLSILLVEPSHTQRRIIIQHLEEVGLHKIDGVSTGGEALEHIASYPPDLVVSAMYFDDMTGTELIHALRETPNGADLPFMLVSSENHPVNLEPIRQAGVLAILPKPFEVEDLRRGLLATVDYLAPEHLELDDLDPEDLRVLVVDDSRFSLRQIVRIVEQMGVERITQAENGREAAEHIAEGHYDLVITDYNMPEMDGQALVNYIRQLSDQPDLPVLMVTSEHDDARLSTVRQAGVSALCDKPFDVTTLRKITRDLLSR